MGAVVVAAENITCSPDVDISSSGVSYEQTRSYYDAANRLAVMERHLGLVQLSNPGGVYEEYRYDALGRRVLVRSTGTYSSGADQSANGPWSFIVRLRQLAPRPAATGNG